MRALFAALAALCLALAAAGQSTQTISTSPGSAIFANTALATSVSFAMQTAGSPNYAGIIIYGCPASGLCTQLDTSTIDSNGSETRSVSVSTVYSIFAVRSVFSGGTNPTLTVTATFTAPATGSGSSGSGSGSGSSGSGSGSGTSSGSVATGTANQVTYYEQNGSTVVGDARLSDNGSTLTYSGLGGFSALGFATTATGPGNITMTPGLFSSLPTCSSAVEGMYQPVTDSTTNTWGATITGGGTNHVFAYCDSTNWTVLGK
jgi:hypothetical protein